MADMQGSHIDTRPVPDPTALTTEASARLEAMLRNLIQTEITHQTELFNERLATLNEKLTTLTVLVNTQYRMLDTRTAEQKSDTKAALDAALAAQKEQVASQNASAQKSIDKSENTTLERIKGVENLLTTNTKTTDDKYNDLKDRVIAIEAIKLGNTEGAATVRQSGFDTRAILTSIIGVALFLLAVAGFAIALLKP